MIVFYQKFTGKIIGTIEGRIHRDDHLKMWIGKKDETERIICQWKPVKEYKNDKGEIGAWDFEPELEQKEIWFNFDKHPCDVYKYEVDLNTKLLKLKK